MSLQICKDIDKDFLGKLKTGASARNTCQELIF